MLVVAVVAFSLLTWCALVWLQLRHLALSALVLAVPALMLGYVALGDVATFLRTYSSAFVLVAAAAALAAGDWIARAVCHGSAPREACREAMRRLVATMAPALVVYALAMAVFSYRLLPWTFAAASVVSVAVAFGTVAGMIRIAAKLAYSEAFIARANAAREHRERAAERLAIIVERRWAFSIAGIAAILATLIGFTIRDMSSLRWGVVFWPHLCVLAALVLAGLAVVARDWRAGVAATLAYALLWAFLFVAFLRGEAMLNRDAVAAFDVSLAALVPLNAVASRFRAIRREGEDVAQAFALALREEGGLVSVTALLWLVPGLAATIDLGVVVPVLMLGIATICAVLLLFPALTVAIHTLLPRYRSVDEVFGKRST